MTINATKGACTHCDKEYTRSGMGKHLASCLIRQSPESIVDNQRFSLLLQVTTRYPSGYWLHLEVDERATFKTLDTFLRKLCPECNWEGEGWLCQKCATSHSCGAEVGFLSIPNSPRAGVCGYTGQ